jgi:uncharacterized protein
MTSTRMPVQGDRETTSFPPEAAAWSSGARRFDFEAPLGTSLSIGAPVLLSADHGDYLGQVVELTPAPLRDDRPGRWVVGQGTLIGSVSGESLAPVDAARTFDTARLRPAPGPLVRSWLAAATAGGASLDVGQLRNPSTESARLVAAGFNRHTFLCGQSGSGKTYAMGVVLEQLLLRTTLRMVIIDPNSDYVALDQLSAGPDGLAATAGPVIVFRAEGSHRLQVRFGRLPLRQQSMVLALDPLADLEEFDALRRMIAELNTTEYAVSDLRQALQSRPGPAEQRLVLRIDNLGVADWSIWAASGEPPLLDQLPADWRAGVVDLGGLGYAEERSAVVASILTGLWHRRGQREPVLIVIDEAHNVCPQQPTDAHQALAIEHAARIAAEGRKYGLFLLLATQSPRKLHVNVLSQCENLLLMKTNSVADVEHLAEVFSHVPRGLVAQATGFALGEGLAAGRISPTPQLFRTGRRLSPEGGADVPTTWAQSRE